MIQAICGKKGSGKTKRILDLANQTAANSDGIVVFIDDDNRYMFDLKYQVRFVNATEYGVNNPDRFYGFLSGLISGNFDIQNIFIDGFLKIIKAPADELEEFFKCTEALADKHNVTLVFSVSGDPDELPAYITKFMV